jgi:microsomal epoxide hydrolase
MINSQADIHAATLPHCHTASTFTLHRDSGVTAFLKFISFITLTSVGWAIGATQIEHRFFETSDGVSLHYLEAGQGRESIVFVPGWLMPAAIFERQLTELSKHYRVLVLDPRSQGQSALTSASHAPARRTADIKEFLAAAKVDQFIFAGWSLGVLEVLDYLAHEKAPGLRGLILIDNSVGEGKPPPPRSGNFSATLNNPQSREKYLREFSHGMFRETPPPAMMQAILDSVLRVPPAVALELINKPYPREHWRNTLEQQTVPVMYAIRPRFEDQANSLTKKRNRDRIRIDVFQTAGHALFVDDAKRFNQAALEFCAYAFAQ